MKTILRLRQEVKCVYIHPDARIMPLFYTCIGRLKEMPISGCVAEALKNHYEQKRKLQYEVNSQARKKSLYKT